MVENKKYVKMLKSGIYEGITTKYRLEKGQVLRVAQFSDEYDEDNWALLEDGVIVRIVSSRRFGIADAEFVRINQIYEVWG